MKQNHGNGHLEGSHLNFVYQRKPGTGSRTPLTTIHPTQAIIGAGAFDLQTAAAPADCSRWSIRG